MMNFLKLAVNATKLLYVYGKSIMKWLNSKNQKVYHIRSKFHCNVRKDFLGKTLSSWET